MKKTVVNFLLVLSGAIIIYEFSIILLKGKIYPIPNIPTFIVYSVLILAVMVFAIWSLPWRRKRFWDVFPNALLFGLSSGLLVGNSIIPIILLVRGQLIMVSSYYGIEPNTAIALGELSMGVVSGLYGLYGLFQRPAG